MSTLRPSRQDKAYWRSEAKHQEKWESEVPITQGDKDYGSFHITCQRIQGFAAGWIAGAAWAKRQRRKTK